MPAMRRAFPVAVVLLALAAPGAALAQARVPPAPRDQVVLSGDVLVPRGRTVGEVVVFRGSATVEGVVDGDVVVLSGPIRVAGQVSGAVVAVDGSVTLERTAQVGGDVIAGDDVERAAAAEVGGDVRSQVRFSLSGPAAALGALLASFAVAVSVLLAAALLVLLAPRGGEHVGADTHSAPAPSALWGLLLGLGIPTIAVLLTATVLGIPFGLSLLLGIGLLWLVGQASATWSLGRLLLREPRSRAGALFAGWGLATAVGLVPGLNVAWWVLGSLFGLGAVLVATWRVRRGAPPTGGRPLGEPADRPGKHRVGRGTPAPPVPAVPVMGTAPPETPLGED
jgi:hypothetical protein